MRRLNNQFTRDDWIIDQLNKLQSGGRLLDAGCGSQRYRKYCSHLKYAAQDFGQYTTDQKQMIGTVGAGGVGGYEYGPIDYVGDIWAIDEKDGFFDVVMCTEVFEHIPYPIDTIREFSRLLKPGGKLVLTAPSNCLRHMDPYFFYTGFTDRWFEKVLSENGFVIDVLQPVGDYYSWLAVELARTARSASFLSKFLLAPAFIYYLLKKKTELSTNTMCMGYHCVATKV